MFKFLEKILGKRSVKIIDSDRENLAKRISAICYDAELIDVIYTPEAKIYLLNTYSKSFSHLVELVTFSNLNRELYSVNCYSYFNNTRHILMKGFKHILNTLLSDTKICPIVFYDISEVVDTIEYLSKKEYLND